MTKGRQVMADIADLIKQLPPNLQREVEDFVRFLMEKRMPKAKGKPDFQWRGALRDLRDKYTSVELQHKIHEWWGD